jgi:hypothetical protein
MQIRAFQAAAILAVLMPASQANPGSRRATITGGGGNGRCTIEVTVDGSAEIEVSADMGLLTTISGQPAAWRRFQCNAPLPAKPVDFRFVSTNGNRGSVRLLQDPRSTGGRAVISINDSKGGRGNYTFDLQWRAGWTPGPSPSPPGHWPAPGGSLMTRTIRICQDSVTDRLNRDGYEYIHFERTVPLDNPGRNDWITGNVSGNQGYGTTWFSFSCSVDFNSGRVRSVDVRPRY